MHRRSSVEPLKTSSQFLHSALQAALESLDVELDEELARYRRLRSRKLRPTERTRTRDRQPDVIAVAAVGHEIETHAAVDHLPAAKTQEAPALERDIQSSPLTPMAIAVGLSQADAVLSSNSAQSDLATVGAHASPLTALNDVDLGPDDYLESSEELLKSIAEEAELRAEREPGMLESLLTPLGIGSMLLLLLSSVTFGYLIMNPSSLNLLGVEKIFGSKDPNSTQPAQTTLNANQAVDPTAPGAPTVPNLANQEFVDLNLDTLSTLPTQGVPQAPAAGSAPAPAAPPASPPASSRPAPAPVVATQPIAPAASAPATPRRRSSQQAAPAPAPARRRAQTPATRPVAPVPARRQQPVAVRPAPPPVQPAPARRSNPAPAPAAAAPVPPQQDLYYVTTDYNSDRSLEQAREAVGDAYVRNFPSGARVQLGAFSERERAQELVQDLQQQGISAQMQQP